MTAPSQVLDYMAGIKASLTDADVRAAIAPVAYDVAHTSGDRIGDAKEKFIAAHMTDYDLTIEYTASKFADDEIKRLEMSSAYLVTADMVDLVEFASRTLPDGTTLRREQMPTEFGMVFFEKPLESIDIHSHRMRIHVVTWGSATDRTRGWLPGVPRTQANKQTWTKRGVRVNFYTDRDDTQDDYSVKQAGEWGHTREWRAYRFQLSESTFWPWDSTFAPYDDEVRLYREVEGIDFDKLPMMPTSESAMAHRLMSFWMLCMQEVADVREGIIDRHTRKRMGRANLPQRISVITLRRRQSNQDHGETYVEWHHRWIVRGHWRQQPYKDRTTGEIYTQPIWISPYIKGPEDKPIIVTEKVYRLAR